MSSILIVYGSTYGQTERIACRIAELLREADYTVDMHRGDQLPDPLTLGTYAGVVVAASVLKGHHQGYIREFVRRHARRLNQLPTAFVSVCGAARGDPLTAEGYLEALLRESGWQPTIARSFTGAVAYTKYPWLLRWVMKRISRQKGLPTDTSRDWDFTEWDQVDRFGRALAATFAVGPAAPVMRAS